MLLDPNFLDLRFLDQNIIEPFFSQNFLIPNLGLKMFLNPISFYHKSGLKHLKKIVCLEHSFNQRCVLTWIFLNLIVLVQHTGRLKKNAWILLYPRICITCKPCNGFTNYFFLLKTEIHTQRSCPVISAAHPIQFWATKKARLVLNCSVDL